MTEMIGVCGIVCSRCEAFLATKNNDDGARKSIAKQWAKEYQHPGLKPEDINCDGCLSDGKRLFSHCTVCEIRKCGRGRGVRNCAYCDEYVCKKLNRFYKIAPGGKATLDGLRKRA